MSRHSTRSVVFIAFLLLSTRPLFAQDVATGSPHDSSLALDVTRGVLLDPTTYAPAAILYTSMRLDWKSSQPFFARGYVEANDRYTISGLPHDVPVSFALGKRQILTDSLLNLPMSFVNNTSSRLAERVLMNQYPSHPKMIRTVGWIERTAFAGYMSSRLAGKHFRQWQQNVTLARQLLGAL